MVPLLEVDEGVVLDLLNPVHFTEGLEAFPAGIYRYVKLRIA
jgi:hypothetical protein